MLIPHKGHTDTMQVYSVTVMTHVKALQAGHSSQGTSEPITQGLCASVGMEKFQLEYRHEPGGAKFTIYIKGRLIADLTILPLRDCEVCVLIVRGGSIEEYSLRGYAIMDFVVRAKRFRATGLNFNLEGQIDDLSNTSPIPIFISIKLKPFTDA